jgi:hypothetical protein
VVIGSDVLINQQNQLACRSDQKLKCALHITAPKGGYEHKGRRINEQNVLRINPDTSEVSA